MTGNSINKSHNLHWYQWLLPYPVKASAGKRNICQLHSEDLSKRPHRSASSGLEMRSEHCWIDHEFLWSLRPAVRWWLCGIVDQSLDHVTFHCPATCGKPQFDWQWEEDELITWRRTNQVTNLSNPSNRYRAQQSNPFTNNMACGLRDNSFT